MKLRFTTAVVIATALLVATGCNDTTQADYSSAFREQASRAGYDIAFVPQDEGRPGMVSGVVRSVDGVRSMFVFSFGPVPDKLPGSFGYSNGAVWFDVGDGLEYWFQNYPSGLNRAKQNRAIRMRLKIENLACHITAGRPCYA